MKKFGNTKRNKHNRELFRMISKLNKFKTSIGMHKTHTNIRLVSYMKIPSP